MGGKSSKRGRKTRTPRAKTVKKSGKTSKVKSWGDLIDEKADGK